MKNRHLLTRIEKIEALLAERGLTAEEPVDVSETLAIIASLGPDMIRLSEVDQKRWYCPDDPRGVLTTEEIEEEAKIKARVLEKCKKLGFPEGYGQRQYKQDGRRLHLLSEKQHAAEFIRFSASEDAEMRLIRARREGIYELGPSYRAYLRILEIDGRDYGGGISRTVCEQHEVDHLTVLHPDEPLDDEKPWLEWVTKILAERGRSPQHCLDEWHAKRGQDPRFFRTLPTWMQFPFNPYVLERQNKQLVEMGFEAFPPAVYHPTKEEYDAERLAYKEGRLADYSALVEKHQNRRGPPETTRITEVPHPLIR